MKNKRIYLNLFLITLFGLLIRLTAINKPEGLWNDEYISWFISTKPLFVEFIQAIFKNCHMPFYYIYLKFWCFCFGNSDVALRISSVLPSILGIITMFFVGKNLKDEKTGLLCAALTSFSGFMIYFSQEVRFYSLLFLFSALAVLLFLKLLEKQSYLNYLLFYIINLMIMFIHTIGFVFVFFNFLILFVYLKKQNKISYKQIGVLVAATLVAMLPFVPFLYKTLTASYISQFWSDFSFTKLFFVFADYVSPIQINLVNTPINVSTLLFRNNVFNWGYVIFAVIPLFIAILGVISAFLKKNEKVNLLAIIGIATLFVMITASSMGKIVLITKYTMEFYPIFIAITAFGLYSTKPEFLRKVLIFSLFAITLTYLFISEYAPQKIKRTEGHKLVANLVTEAKLNPNDRILLLYYDSDRFGKYMSTDEYIIESITKYNFQYRLIFNPPLHTEVVKNGKKIFLSSFQNASNDYFNQYLQDRFFSNMKKGDRFALISLNSVAFIDKERMKTVISDEKFYERMPFLFLIFSHISNMTQTQADLYLKPVYHQIEGKWEIFVWEKI